MRKSCYLITLLVILALPAAVAAPFTASPIADAVEKGEPDSLLQNLLKNGADVNAAQGDGMTALHWAADRGDADLAAMLIQAGAQVDAVTRIGSYQPIHIAAREGHLEVVEILLDNGADVDARTSVSGVTPLHLAASSGNAELVARLLECGATIDAREADWGQTPLIFAAAKNRVDAIRTLLGAGADPSITTRVIDYDKENKLVNAANSQKDKVLAALDKTQSKSPTPKELAAAVLAGRDVYLSGEIPKDKPRASSGGRSRFRNRPTYIKKGGLTALLHAARQGHLDALKALLDGGADINQVSDSDATSPLLMATINAQFDVAMYLLERGADPNLASSVNGVAPLWAAVNAEWQPRTRYPQPQEHRLQKATYLDVMEALLEAGAKPNVRLTRHPWYMVYSDCGNANCGLEDTAGSTAFWRAAYATDVEAMRLLVKYGADPNIPTKAPAPRGFRGSADSDDDDSDTPKPLQPGGPSLWPATNAASVRPDPSGLPKVKEGGPGVYPIHAASGVGYGEGYAGNAHRHAPNAWLAAVKYLVEELGADVNARDYNGYNALHHAAARGDNELILYLVEKGCDVTAISRRGQTTADMANGPVSRISPIPETVALLEKLGSKNSHHCVSC